MKFSLRDLFWLVALVAIGCGWWVEHAKAISLAGRVELYIENIQLLAACLRNQGMPVQSLPDGRYEPDYSYLNDAS